MWARLADDGVQGGCGGVDDSGCRGKQRLRRRHVEANPRAAATRACGRLAVLEVPVVQASPQGCGRRDACALLLQGRGKVRRGYHGRGG